MGLEFEHRSSDSPLVERVWRSRSLGVASMTSVARAHWDFVYWEDANGAYAGVQGPESRASQAPVPVDATFLGVRLALGVFPADLPLQQLVDRFAELPVQGRRFCLGDHRLRVPRYDEAEDFVAFLVRRGLLVTTSVDDLSGTERTCQRRYLRAVGLPQRTVRQIDRAHEAAVRLGEGQPSAAVAQECGYFDQSHLARSLRRFIGRSATELAGDIGSTRPLSLLYKTDANRDR